MADRGLRKLVIVGVGLIGGSFALALRKAGNVERVIGVGRERANLELARRQGIIDRACTIYESWTAELADADLVLLATPVGEMPALFASIARALGPRTVLTDAGSTKQDVVAAARARLGAALPRFVPGHPIAGTERSGADAAFADLFRDRRVVLTPLAETDPAALARVSACWARCGALVRLLDAARHDALLAAVSHLPHLLSFVLMTGLGSRADAADCFEYAGTGFRDFTRLAGGEPTMWRYVCLANRIALRAELAEYLAQLEQVDALLARADGAALLKLLERARAARGRLIEARGESGDA